MTDGLEFFGGNFGLPREEQDIPVFETHLQYDVGKRSSFNVRDWMFLRTPGEEMAKGFFS